jgi:drug/metabolite transporter (DMT)-like permease
VVRGVHLKHTRPWLDVIVASSLLIAVLTIHVATRPLRIVHPMTTAACVALLAALAAICCVWWIHGQQRWSLRLAGLVTGLAVIAAALLGIDTTRDSVARLILLGFTAAVSGAIPELLLAFLVRKYTFDGWPEMVCGFTALAVLLAFSIFRLHGYQLARGPCAGGSRFGN